MIAAPQLQQLQPPSQQQQRFRLQQCELKKVAHCAEADGISEIG